MSRWETTMYETKMAIKMPGLFSLEISSALENIWLSSLDTNGPMQKLYS